MIEIRALPSTIDPLPVTPWSGSHAIVSPVTERPGAIVNDPIDIVYEPVIAPAESEIDPAADTEVPKIEVDPLASKFQFDVSV